MRVLHGGPSARPANPAAAACLLHALHHLAYARGLEISFGSRFSCRAWDAIGIRGVGILSFWIFVNLVVGRLLAQGGSSSPSMIDAFHLV
jgi:hypothetical protein